MQFSVDDLLGIIANGTSEYVEKPWGSEHIIHTSYFIIKLINIKAGHRTSLQLHNIKTEVIYVISGPGMIKRYETPDNPDDTFGPCTYTYAGHSVRIEPGVIHQSVGPVTLLEITTPHNDDIVRIEDYYGRA